MRENELLWCSCCGKGVRNNAEENVSYGQVPYPHDDEYGLCRECGGDARKLKDDVSAMTEAELKEAMGWEATTFYEARFPVVRKSLKPEHQTKWDEMPYVKKVAFVQKMLEKGVLQW